MIEKAIIYTSNSCKFCQSVKTFLQDRNIQFETKNISEDVEAKKELISKGFMGVPVVFVGDKVCQGFKPEVLEEIVKDIK